MKRSTSSKYTRIPIGKDLFGKSSFVYRRFQKSDNPVNIEIAPPFESNRPVFVGYDLHIQPNGISAIAAFSDNSFRGGCSSEKSRENLKSNRVKGELSKASKKKLNRSVNWLVAASKTHRVWSKQAKKHYSFKCAFVTLTLPSSQGSISDNHFKRHMLAKFIDWMKKTKAVNEYIWKVEVQKNNNIHAHIVINQFIHYNDVRREWLKICNENGLIEKDKYVDNLQAVPCTEIKAVRKVRKLGAYVAKYLSKNESQKDNRKIVGRLWACSYGLSSANKLVVRADTHDTDELTAWWNDKRVRTIAIQVASKITGVKRTIGYHASLDVKLWREVVCDELKELYKVHIWNIQSGMRTLPISYYSL